MTLVWNINSFFSHPKFLASSQVVQSTSSVNDRWFNKSIPYSMTHNNGQDAAGATTWSKWRAEMGDRCHVWGIPILHTGRDGQWSEPASPAIRESYWGRHTLDLEVRISEMENNLYCPCWSPRLQLGLSPTQTSCHISQQSPSCCN